MLNRHRPRDDGKRSLKHHATRAWEQGRRAVAPLIGYPGLTLSHSTVKQNQFNHATQYQSIARLYDRLLPDAMLFLMDLSVEASALGLPVRFPLEETPTVEGHPIRSAADLASYRNIDVLADGRVMVYLEVMHHMRAGLNVPVGAYVTGPFTLAGLMMGANELAMGVVLDPESCHEALEFATGVILRYAKALLDSGADFIVILDPTAVMLGPKQYAEFAGAYVRELTGLLDETEIVLHICGDTNHILPHMVATGADALSLDHPMDMGKVARIVGPDMLLIGNVDPVLMLHGSAREVTSVTDSLLAATEDHAPFVLSTGCDVPQGTPWPNIEALVDAGRAWTRETTPIPEPEVVVSS